MCPEVLDKLDVCLQLLPELHMTILTGRHYELRPSREKKEQQNSYTQTTVPFDLAFDKQEPNSEKLYRKLSLLCVHST